MKRTCLHSERQSFADYVFTDQYSMVSLVKGSQSTVKPNITIKATTNISNQYIKTVTAKPHLHQIHKPRPALSNKQNYPKQSDSSSRRKKKREGLSKNKDKKILKQDVYKIKKQKKLKKVKEDKEERFPYEQPKEPFRITIMNTQQTQSIMWYEQSKIERGLGCSEQLSWVQMPVQIKSSQIERLAVKKRKNYQQEILDFEKETKKNQIQFQSQTMTEMSIKERKYKTFSGYINYLSKKQPQVSWMKRAIVINWMIEVLTSFGNKRETFAISVNFLDRYLSSIKPISLQKLQLVAGVCLLIANKMQDRLFDVYDLFQAMGKNYPIEQILKYEIKIVTKLQWKLNPPSAFMWANRLSAQWDAYVEENPPNKTGNHPNLLLISLQSIKFRTEDINGYNNYRELMQYIDLTVLDIHTLQYHSREIAISFLYIILNLRLFMYSKEEVIQIFPSSSQYILSPNPLNLYFEVFLQETFNFFLQDLLPTIQYCSTFISIPVSLQLPPAAQQSKEMTYSQFCAFQTCNDYNLIFLQKRNRDFD